MKLNSIELHYFRSYEQQRFEFAAGGNLIIGANGSGKTNLLEAIAYTSIGKSIRYHQDVELIKAGKEHFTVSARYTTDINMELKVRLAYAKMRKILKLNNEVKHQLSSLFSVIKVIYCAPDDIGLINGSPRIRRQYFDLAISQIFPQYIAVLRDYLHVVEQRNQLLKKEFSLEEKKSWDIKFAESLCALYPYRKRYLDMLNRQFTASYQEISPKTKNLKLSYSPVLHNAFELELDDILMQLQQYESREKIWQRCLVGAHLDDYGFSMERFGMRAYSSQGQKRIAVILLKLIQAKLIESNTNISPILLFDDVFAELDYSHGEKIQELCKENYQIFIASPKEDVRQIFGKMPIIRLGDSA
ncbi:MAG: DNA replication and repair protein RecF [Candidatus Cloacimonetes bacterium]|nr:DNA replication and repair protein RecF [Candidatus Cloacimonadota bacterium]MDD2211103.1 DNA replication and repair protein RecF [Candidatus Cloacimonadota bacterium]MDY0298710.1 DNA replication and repair protein RecF [Candidatus Cloacimonadaceae bacterium]